MPMLAIDAIIKQSKITNRWYNLPNFIIKQLVAPKIKSKVPFNASEL